MSQAKRLFFIRLTKLVRVEEFSIDHTDGNFLAKCRVPVYAGLKSYQVRFRCTIFKNILASIILISAHPLLNPRSNHVGFIFGCMAILSIRHGPSDRFKINFKAVSNTYCMVMLKGTSGPKIGTPLTAEPFWVILRIPPCSNHWSATSNVLCLCPVATNFTYNSVDMNV